MSKELNSKTDLLKELRAIRLWKPEARLLVAVSAGMDSMVLAHALCQIKAEIAVAHVNYGLRGADSDEDEHLVQTFCRQRGIPVYVLNCQKEGLIVEDRNTQLWARRLRYDWFKQLQGTHRFDLTVTAHHLDDQVETILYRLSRGSGLKGIVGMQTLEGSLCRPLLHIPKTLIEQYAEIHQVPFRHDSSNDSLEYDRNYVRHKIVPHFQKINPSFNKRLADNANHWRMAAEVLDEHLTKELQSRLMQKPQFATYQTYKQDSLQLSSLLLHHWLSPLGFTSTQTEDAASFLIEGSAGQLFEAGPWRLICNRHTLHLTKERNQTVVHRLSPGESLSTRLGTISLVQDSISILPKPLKLDPGEAALDFDKLILPLTVRSCQAGDYFHPLGLGGRKKINKHLRDLKMSTLEKEDQLVCTSNDEICWVVGDQIDERFKIEESTSQIARLKLTPNDYDK